MKQVSIIYVKYVDLHFSSTFTFPFLANLSSKSLPIDKNEDRSSKRSSCQTQKVDRKKLSSKRNDLLPKI